MVWQIAISLSLSRLQPLCLCVAQLVAFILWERRRGDTALIPLKLFRSRTMIGSTIAAAFTRFVVVSNAGHLWPNKLARLTMFIAIFELPLYFQAVKGHSPTRAGIDMIPITIALVFASGVFGTLTSVGCDSFFEAHGPLIRCYRDSVASGISWSSVLYLALSDMASCFSWTSTQVGV